jgi:dephospho-CoA kinase
VIDADAVAREVTAPGEPALEAVIDRFGEMYRRDDGSLDRAALGRLVFSDPAALRDLEAIVHPAVRSRIQRALTASAEDDVTVTVIEAIKLIEGGLAEKCDEVWLVTCDPATQRDRLIGRGLAQPDADQRIAAQGDLVVRLRPAATLILDTSGSVAETRQRVSEAWANAMGGGGTT